MTTSVLLVPRSLFLAGPSRQRRFLHYHKHRCSSFNDADEPIVARPPTRFAPFFVPRWAPW